MPRKDRDSKGENERKAAPPDETPLDLASRIGTRSSPEPSGPPQNDARPTFIGMHEPPSAALPEPTRASPEPGAGDATGESAPVNLAGAITSRRTPPGRGEIDVVVTPLASPDDWHEFEIEFRRVRGITQLRPEYYRHGVAKMRVMWEGQGRLAQVLRAGIPGFRVRVIGEDKGTLQILVSRDNEERRPS